MSLNNFYLNDSIRPEEYIMLFMLISNIYRANNCFIELQILIQLTLSKAISFGTPCTTLLQINYL